MSGGRWFRFGSRRDVDRELDDEIRFHLDRTIDKLLDAGWSLPEAEREAYRRFGDVNRYRRALRRLDKGKWSMRERREWFGNLFRDLTYAARALRREPALTLGITLTLALGIGANATMFGIVDRLLLSAPPHVREPERLRRVMAQEQFRGRTYYQDSRLYADYLDLQQVESFASVAAFAYRQMTLGYGDSARPVDAALATASLFPTLGVEPARGRFFTADEDRPDGTPVAVLGWEFWQGQYGGDESVLGQTLEIAETDYVVVGIAPAGFSGIDLQTKDVWLPLHVAGKQAYPRLTFDDDREGWRIYWLDLVVRLADGASVAAADAQADAVYQATIGDDEAESRLFTAPVLADRGPNASEESRVSLWLGGVSLVVLLVACANVASMLLARGVRRRGEVGVRLALGIPRSRLVRQLLVESLLLATLGGAAALLVAHWGGGVVRAALLPRVGWTRPVLDPTQLGFTLLLSLLTGLAAGALPALQWRRQDVMDTLKSGGRGAAGRSRTRSVLLVLQAALSVLLLVGAGLFVRSLWQFHAADVGIDDPSTLVVAAPEKSTEARNEETFRWPEEEILSRLRKQPAVAHATAAITSPFGNSWSIPFSLPDRDAEELPQVASGTPYVNPVASDYFETLGLRILRGRSLTEQDRDGATPVTVLNATMARLLWPDEEAIGKCVLVGNGENDAPPPCTTVVGVVEDATRSQVGESDTMQYYVPIDQQRLDDRVAFLVRLAPGTEAAPVVNDVQRTILQAAPAATRYVDAYPLEDKIAPQARAWRLGASLFTAFGALAVLVAAIGLYGVLAFDVAQRTRELGVRSALGATAARLRLLVLGQGLRLTAVGIALGMLVSLLAGPRLESLLFRVSPRDPVVFASVVVVLLAVAGLASWLPGLRATRIDPNEALRVE